MSKRQLRRRIVDSYRGVGRVFRLVRVEQEQLSEEFADQLQINWVIVHEFCSEVSDSAASGARRGEFAAVIPSVRAVFELCMRMRWAAGSAQRLGALNAYWQQEFAKMLNHALKAGLVDGPELESEKERVKAQYEEHVPGTKVGDFKAILRAVEPQIQNGMSVGRSIHDGLMNHLHGVAHANPYWIRDPKWSSHGLVGCQFLGYAAECLAVAVGKHYYRAEKCVPHEAREMLVALFDDLRELDQYVADPNS